MLPVAPSSTTDPAVTGVDAGAGPVKRKVAAVMADGSMRKPAGSLNVALTAALGQTLPAFAAGLVDSTEMLAGVVAAAVVKLQT